MANKKIIEAKAAQVESIREKIAKAQSVVVFDYRGLTVEEDTKLRSEMRKAGVEYSVLKNGIVERAAKLDNIDDSFQSFLMGPSAFAFGYDDVVAPAKILKTVIDKSKKGSFKGGIINGVVSDADAITTLADLPSREVLLSRLLGSMMSPISGLAIALDQVAKKNGAGEEAPAAE